MSLGADSPSSGFLERTFSEAFRLGSDIIRAKTIPGFTAENIGQSQSAPAVLVQHQVKNQTNILIGVAVAVGAVALFFALR